MSTSALGAFQHEFSLALLSRDASGVAAHPAFAVYRNTVAKGCIDALEANFPAVVRLVGRDWFRSVAAMYVKDAPPRDPRLLNYGRDFPAFLGRQAAATELPYLADVAALDRCWVDCHTAADALAFPAARLAALAPDALGALRIAPHPAARWRWYTDMPIFSIWSRNRVDPTEPEVGIAWQGEGVLITRPDDTVQWCAVSPGACALLTACLRGHTLADAAQTALDTEPACDLTATLALLLRQGAFAD